MAAAAAYDRPSIFRYAWCLARRAAAKAAEGVRLHIGAAMRTAWAEAKAALGAPAKPAAPVAPVPVQLDLVEYIAALPPVAATPVAPAAPAAPASPRRFEHDGYTLLFTPITADGDSDVTIFRQGADGSEHVVGAVRLKPAEYRDLADVLQDSLSVLEEPEPAQQPQPEPAPQVQPVSHLSDRLAELARERDEYRAEWLEYRRERIAIVNGEMEGDAGIAWTNEEWAEARYDDAVERYDEAYQEEWYASSLAA